MWAVPCAISNFAGSNMHLKWDEVLSLIIALPKLNGALVMWEPLLHRPVPHCSKNAGDTSIV